MKYLLVVQISVPLSGLNSVNTGGDNGEHRSEGVSVPLSGLTSVNCVPRDGIHRE